MLEKARNLWTKFLTWWRWRDIRRKQRAFGVKKVVDMHGGDPHVYPAAYMEGSYIAPPSRGGGSICSMREKLGGLYLKWTGKRPRKKSTELPSWEQLMRALEATQSDIASSN